MLTHPEEESYIAAVPGAASIEREERGVELAVLTWSQDADTPGPVCAFSQVQGHISLPDHGEEQRAGAGHDGDVGEEPVAIVGLELLGHEQEERVARRGAHSVVRDPRGVGRVYPGGELQEGVHPAVAPIVEVEVYAAVVREDEVPDCVGALDVVGVGEEGGEEPGVFFRDEGEVGFIGPEAVFVVWMQGEA